MENYEQKFYELLDLVASYNASDLHISVGRRPILRIDGDLAILKDKDVLTSEATKAMANIVLSTEQIQELETRRAVDLSYSYKKIARFRINVYYQFGALSIALRFIPEAIKTIKELNLPDVLHKFNKYQQGLVLITGPANHGKSTTLAALVDEINKTRMEHIITVEDPIEYIFTQDKSMIDQREVGRDTPDFNTALRDSFRQDPDVLVVGEMRDPETISMAITAAETGHLVLATLHTNNAAQTIFRIIDSFPSDQQAQIRAQLALTLVGIVSQRLIMRINGGRIPAVEVLFANSAVRNLIREQKVHEINLVIETSSDEGMIYANRYLADLIKRGEISQEIAENYSLNSKELVAFIKKS